MSIASIFMLRFKSYRANRLCFTIKNIIQKKDRSSLFMSLGNLFKRLNF